MTSSALMNLIVVIVVGIIGWLMKTIYDNWTKKVDGKMDKGCHDICTKEKEKMNQLLLDEIRGLRGDFKEKSKIVIDAVEKK